MYLVMKKWVSVIIRHLEQTLFIIFRYLLSLFVVVCIVSFSGLSGVRRASLFIAFGGSMNHRAIVV
jgi:hypothetical protein